MRKLEYVNSNSETITFQDSPYLITSIEGLGIPPVDRQEQKAPYQDGTTYIDSLLQNRDIVVELAIIAPNDFSNIATYRRALSQRLCPKYGQGSLTYTDEAGNAYQIGAVVSSMVFPNKDYREPFMRCMVTFTANEPYWRDVTEDSINLPTAVTSGESVINAANGYQPCVIKLSNGNLFIVYARQGDRYLVSRTFTTSWSAESAPINSAQTIAPCVIELSNGNLFLVYVRTPDLYVVSRTFTTSWSAESVINSTSSNTPSVIELLNGNLFLVYSLNIGESLRSRTYTGSWSAETVINASGSSYSKVIQLTNGNLFLIYVSSNRIVCKIYTTSWGNEIEVDSASSIALSAIQRPDGDIFIAYRRSSDGYLVSKTYRGLSGSPSVINAANSYESSLLQVTSNILLIVYRRASDDYIVSVTRSVTSVPAINTGDVPTPVQITFQGPAVNPRVIKQSTLEFMRINTTLAAGDYFVIDTTFGNKTVKLMQGGIEVNGIAFMDLASTFFSLDPGSNTVYFEDDAVLSTATATMEWTGRYAGI